jgi:hypothetical protein
MRVVMITDDLPTDRPLGHIRYTRQIIDMLVAAGCEIHVLVTRPSIVPAVQWYRRHFATGIHVRGRNVRRIGPFLLNLSPGCLAKHYLKRAFELTPAPLTNLLRRLGKTAAQPDRTVVLGRYPSAKERQFSDAALAALAPDAVLVNTVFLAPLAESFHGGRRFLIAHDVYHRRAASMSRLGFRVEPDLDFAREVSLMAIFDVVLAIQEEEADVMRGMTEPRRVICVPMALGDIAESLTWEGHRCVFVGSSAAHNRDAAEWLITTIWPDVRRAIPDAELHIFGSVCNWVPSGAGVHLRGVIGDLNAELGQAALALNPLRAGSGLKIKMMDYFANGLPCVTTQVGVEGIPPLADPAYYVADSAEVFAARIIQLLHDPVLLRRMRLATQAYRPLFAARNIGERLAAEFAP